MRTRSCDAFRRPPVTRGYATPRTIVTRHLLGAPRVFYPVFMANARSATLSIRFKPENTLSAILREAGTNVSDFLKA